MFNLRAGSRGGKIIFSRGHDSNVLRARVRDLPFKGDIYVILEGQISYLDLGGFLSKLFT